MNEEYSWIEYQFDSGVEGVALRGRLNQIPSQSGNLPIVIMLTGDGPKGTKSLSWTNLPPLLAKKGIRSFLFDFAGLGYSDGSRRELTCDVGVRNLKSAFRFLRQLANDDNVKIGAFASSYGANILICSPSIANQMTAIALKSPAAFLPDAYFNELGTRGFQQWRENGFSELNGYNFEVMINCITYNGFVTASEIKTPCIITHGTADAIVPYSQSVILNACWRGNSTLELFEGVGHGYSEDGAWNRMADLIVSWLEQELKAQ